MELSDVEKANQLNARITQHRRNLRYIAQGHFSTIDIERACSPACFMKLRAMVQENIEHQLEDDHLMLSAL